MISLHHVSLSFGTTVIFDGASLKINPGQRIGICAPNGTGKTTLLGCIAGEMEVHSGSVAVPEKLRLSYFHQQGVELGSKLIREELEEAFGQYLDLEEQIADLENEIARLSAQAHESHESQGKEQQEHQSRPSAYEKDMGRLGRAIDQLEHLHQLQNEVAYAQREAAMIRMLKGLGFGPDALDRPGGEFSGGWQMKVGLAKVLLSRPDVLMLDEPTNHLDLEARMWLLETLKKLPCTQIIISHDRYFLDHTIDSVAELRNGKITLYAGNYSQYQLEREKQAQALAKRQLAHQRLVKKEEAFIERFRYKATKARQVQSRIKLLDKIEAPETGSCEAAQVRLSFRQSRLSGEQVLEIENISKNYGDFHALDNIHFTLGRGEKVALLGANGAGKSTLLRIIAAQDKSYTGKLRWGPNVHWAYFSQRAADLLSENESIWDYINSLESAADELSRRKTLGMFLFSENDVFQTIASLSGGEKARVLLCSLVLQPCNFLVLDEPSNHLDLDTQQILLEALQDFPGTVLFTTHDRYLLEQLATKIVLLDSEHRGKTTGGARSTVYYGDYAYFLWKRAQPEVSVAISPKQASPSAESPPPANRASYEADKERRARHRKLQREEEALLQKIDVLEAEIAVIQGSFSSEDVYADAEKLRQQKQRLSDKEAQLAACHLRREDICSELER